jgi:ATP-binding cassette subfamily C protein CydC
MADADTTGMALIQATAPMTVSAATAAGGFLVIAITGHLVTAVIVAASAAVCAALAVATARHPDTVSQARSALRTELVTAAEAWPEMASLGAADQLAQRTLGRVATFADRQFRQAANQARARAWPAR